MSSAQRLAKKYNQEGKVWYQSRLGYKYGAFTDGKHFRDKVWAAIVRVIEMFSVHRRSRSNSCMLHGRVCQKPILKLSSPTISR